MHCKRLRQLACLVFLGLVMSFSVGCTDHPFIESIVDATAAPGMLDHSLYSDEMYTVTETKEEAMERYRRVFNMNDRLLREEWATFWLFDKPRRHSLAPPIR